jgi:hypothetical protein
MIAQFQVRVEQQQQEGEEYNDWTIGDNNVDVSFVVGTTSTTKTSVLAIFSNKQQQEK